MSFSTSPKPSTAATYAESTLSNGIKLSTKEFPGKVSLLINKRFYCFIVSLLFICNPHSHSRFRPQVASFKFSVSAGSAYESLSQKGAAQLVATSAFCSTAKTSSIRLVRDLENIGAVFESSADREQITLSLAVPSEKAETAFGIVGQFFAYGPNAPYLVEESKEVAEIAYQKHYSSPTSVLSEMIHEAAFGEGSPYGSSFYASSVDKLNPTDVLAFRSSAFKAGSTFIAASGVEHKSVQAWSETAFQSLASGANKLPSFSFTGGDVKLKADTEGVAYCALAFPVPAGEAGKEAMHAFDSFE